jgi:SAM-dependent methyltransferase
VEDIVAGRTINSLEDYAALQDHLKDLRTRQPMIADNSVDLVVSNCVINLVDTASKGQVLQEIFRVLKPGGRIALSDNVSNIPVPDDIKNDPELWVGCYAGVYQEQEFYRALSAVGFVGLTIEDRAAVPEKTIGDVTFHSVTVTATKPGQAPHSAVPARVLYKGPWSEVTAGAGMALKRGEVTEVSAEIA